MVRILCCMTSAAIKVSGCHVCRKIHTFLKNTGVKSFAEQNFEHSI